MVAGGLVFVNAVLGEGLLILIIIGLHLFGAGGEGIHLGVVIVHTGHIQLHIGLISFGGDAGAKIGFQHGLYRVKTVLLGAGFQLLGAAVQLSLGSLGNGIASGICIQAHGLILGPGLEGVVQEELLPGHGGAGHAAGLLV